MDVIGKTPLPTGQHPDMIEVQVQHGFWDLHLPANVPRRDLVIVRHATSFRSETLERSERRGENACSPSTYFRFPFELFCRLRPHYIGANHDVRAGRVSAMATIVLFASRFKWRISLSSKAWAVLENTSNMPTAFP